MPIATSCLRTRAARARSKRRRRSVTEARIHPIKLPQQRRPLHHAERTPGLRLVVEGGLVQYRLADKVQLGPPRHGGQLRAARELAAMPPLEGFAHGLADGEHAVVAQD